jgi:hypothetical protein
VPKATTIRFTDEMFARLDQASARTGMPVNSIVVAACLEWLALHVERTAAGVTIGEVGVKLTAPPRWATLRRALGQAVTPGVYPLKNFTRPVRELLTTAQAEAEKHGHTYIGTEHLLLACFGDPRFHSAVVLRQLGIDKQAVETILEHALGPARVERHEQIVPTSRVKRVIEIAFKLAASTDSLVGTEHVLLALSKEGEGIAAHMLGDLGATPDRIAHEVDLLKDPES